MSTTLKDDTVTCRKPHTCNWCGEKINAGEKANSWSCLVEGDFNHGYLHLECRDALARSDFYDDEGYYPYEQERGKAIDEYGDTKSMEADK